MKTRNESSAALSRITLLGAVLAALPLVGCSAATSAKTAGSPAGKMVGAAKGSRTPLMIGETPAVTFTLVDSPVDTWVIGSIDRRIRNGQTRGHERLEIPFEVSSLPLVTIPAPLEDKDAPATLNGEPAGDIQIKKNPSYGYDPSGGTTYNAVTPTGATFKSGFMSIGGQEATFATGINGAVTGGLSIQCAPWSRVVAAHWEGVVAKSASSSTPAYELVEGWFDMKQCKLVETRRTHVALAEIVPGTLYGYRTCDDGDCVGHQSVVLVAPTATNPLSQNGPLRSQRGTQLPKYAMPVKRGTSESFLAMIPPASNSTVTRTLSVEINQGTADDAPLATVFVADMMN